MQYFQLHLVTTKQHLQLITDLLTQFNAIAITEQLPQEESSATIELVALFTAEKNNATVADFFAKNLGPKIILNQYNEYIEEQDWQKVSIQDIKPQFFGRKLCIYPSWDQPPNTDKINIQLDPGLAFGTGTHATTAMCLNWLDANIHGGETIIDYGCGSGILAIAALKLGAKIAYAVDIDPVALTVTDENREKNQIEKETLQTFLHEKLPSMQADLLIANILANPLMELAQLFATLTASRGKIVLSGVLESQAKKVASSYKTWFEIDPPQIHDGWALIVGTKH